MTIVFTNEMPSGNAHLHMIVEVCSTLENTELFEGTCYTLK